MDRSMLMPYTLPDELFTRYQVAETEDQLLEMLIKIPKIY